MLDQLVKSTQMLGLSGTRRNHRIPDWPAFISCRLFFLCPVYYENQHRLHGDGTEYWRGIRGPWYVTVIFLAALHNAHDAHDARDAHDALSLQKLLLSSDLISCGC